MKSGGVMEKNIFLAAKWQHLAMLNFEVDPAILKPYLPYGTEIDLYHNQAIITLNSFLFENTKILGILPVPFHRNFEEVNLRFYVKRKQGSHYKRGIVFIKEIVRLPTLALAANTLYRENYVTMDTHHDVKPGSLYTYHWGENFVSIETGRKPHIPKMGSKEAFIVHQHEFWGFSKVNNTTTYEYEVQHTPWKVWLPDDIRFSIDAEDLFGIEFEPFINEKNLTSAYLADGSDVTVHFPNTISKPHYH
jgi:uncharacterized protein